MSFVIEIIVFGVEGSKTVLLNNRIIFVHILSAIKKRVERVVGLQHFSYYLSHKAVHF